MLSSIFLFKKAVFERFLVLIRILGPTLRWDDKKRLDLGIFRISSALVDQQTSDYGGN